MSNNTKWVSQCSKTVKQRKNGRKEIFGVLMEYEGRGVGQTYID
jgi:hypothetical protein